MYGMISYLIGFWLIPRLWRDAKERGWLTLADAFRDLYNSRFVAGFVALTGALWSIPYVQLQIQGMGYIIEVSGYGYIDPLTAKVVAFTLLAIFVIIGGLVSVASINALQGAIMLIAIWFIGIVSPIVAFGGIDKLFNTLTSYNPPPSAKFHLYPTTSDLYFLYSIILIAPMAFWLWPNRVQNIFGARDEETVKRNMVLVGIYQLSQIPAILVGLTAVGLVAKGLLNVPIHVKEYADQSFMLVARTLFNPFIVGLIGAGALAASISTAAAILHVSGALFSKNIVFAKNEKQLLIYARLFTCLIALISLILAIYAPGALIYLLLVGYAGIVQFFPEYIIALKKPGLIDKYTAVTAMSAGMIVVGYVKYYYGRIWNIYEGLWGLLANLLVLSIMLLIKKLIKGKQ
ncbi:Na+/solute symporter [Staphylothermus marinus F1]|uniref:Na+/solute symporter n=2 Tax=Staphylothermus marinus TaxID=2280 RepID=A3DMD1_STAMF|nr:Na+/solute symporter [Staphylothermus marinus F1]